jgi:hypothetical protein
MQWQIVEYCVSFYFDNQIFTIAYECTRIRAEWPGTDGFVVECELTLRQIKTL